MAQEERDQVVPEITCQEVARWASAYLDDNAGDERKRQIVLHLAICAGCEAYVKQIATVREIVRVLPRTEDATLNIGRLQQAFLHRSNCL
ncbi:MAG: zf-HC2 domain-containing protein [Nitrospira sp.]